MAYGQREPLEYVTCFTPEIKFKTFKQPFGRKLENLGGWLRATVFNPAAEFLVTLLSCFSKGFRIGNHVVDG